MGVNLPSLTWLRYSTFLFLYPLGVAGELGLAYFMMPKMDPANWPCGVYSSCGMLATACYRMGLPGLIALYGSCFLQLFSTMLAQRRKGLARRSAKKMA